MAMRRAALKSRLYTFDEFTRMPEYAERFELLYGRLVEKPVPKIERSEVANALLRAFIRFDPAEKLGIARTEVTFKVTDNTGPVPDLSYWTAARRPTWDMLVSPYADIAIEIQSPNQSLKSLQEKARLYVARGVKIVWIIQPGKQTVEVYQPGQIKPQTIKSDGTLSGEEVLPGFIISMNELFAYKRNKGQR